MATKHPLLKRIVHVSLDAAIRRDGRSGTYYGVVTRVDWGPRKGLVGATLRRANGRELRIATSEIREVHYCRVWRTLQEYLEMKKAKS